MDQSKSVAAERMVGQALYGCVLTGYLAVVAAIALFFMGNGQGAGICFAAAALSFGLAANALLRS